MTYNYQCTNEKCRLFGKVAYRELPMNDSSTPQHCVECKIQLERKYTSPSIKTGDGTK